MTKSIIRLLILIFIIFVIPTAFIYTFYLLDKRLWLGYIVFLFIVGAWSEREKD